MLFGFGPNLSIELGASNFEALRKLVPNLGQNGTLYVYWFHIGSKKGRLNLQVGQKAPKVHLSPQGQDLAPLDQS